jgi:hypothetical protein
MVDPLRLIHPTFEFRFMERNAVTKQSRCSWALTNQIASSQRTFIPKRSVGLLTMTNFKIVGLGICPESQYRRGFQGI